MANKDADTAERSVTIQEYLRTREVNSRIQELLRDRASSFITTITSMVNQDEKLAKCEPKSLLMAALKAAALNLPVDPNLGRAFIIPYKQKDGTYQAQLQLGWKAFVDLAQRTGRFVRINATAVKEGEIVATNHLTGEITFDWKADREGLETIGYAAYMELDNGFKKEFYMTNKELGSHATQYSKSYKYDKKGSLWATNYDAMAKKTVIKLMLSKYAPLSTDMQQAQMVDQAVIRDDYELDYVDNPSLDLPEPDHEEVDINDDQINDMAKKLKGENDD